MFKKTILRVIAVLVAVVFVLSTGFWLGINFYSLKELAYSANSSLQEVTSKLGVIKEDKQAFSVKPLEEAINLISSDFLYEKDKEELLSDAIEGMLEGLDDNHAEYFTEQEYQKIMESYSGTMSGIGVVVTVDEQDRVVIINVIPGTPADSEELKEQDIIMEVEGQPIKGMPLEKVVSLIKGEEGTSVNLTIYRPSEDESFEADIIRERFYVPNFTTQILEDGIGYIYYMGFQDNGAEKLEQRIEKLKDDGAKGIILDLRNNLGGVLDDAVAICDLFLDGGTIVTVQGRSGDQERIATYKAQSGGYTDMPMVVLINSFSASASELTAGALKDNNRAVLIGETSYGKGTVQTIQELSNGAGLKFTTAKYMLPSGKSIDGTGIKPDIAIELDIESDQDNQLEKAIEELRSMIGDQNG
jgi:carboxyl-terminal processing protease